MLVFLMVFILVLVLALALAQAAPSLGLLAYPGEHRRHQQPTPMVGGIAMLAGISAGIYISDEDIGLLPAMFLICLVGALDDRFKLPSWLRFIAQGLAAYLMIELTGVQLSSLGSLVSEREVVLQSWSIPLTIFAVIGVINALNMSDGLDGLAGGLVLLLMLIIAVRSPSVEYLAVIIVCAVAGFLVLNLRIFRERAKVFMGDAGSTLLGLLVSYLLIRSAQAPLEDFPPVTALWLFALPLLDAVAVLLIRPIRGQSPFSADRIHYHHLIQSRGLSVNLTLMIVLAIQLILALIGLGLNQAGIAESHQLLAFLVIFGVYFLCLLRFTEQKID